MKSSSKAERQRPKSASKGKPTYNVSRVKSFLRCRKMYYFRYDYPREELGKKGELVPSHPSLPLKKGSWMHELLAAHWRGDGWETKQEELETAFNKLFIEERELFGDLPTECRRLMRRYLRFHAEDDENYKIARLPKGGPAVEFVVEVPLQKWHVNGVFKGQIDLLVRDLQYGGYWIRDAKWVKTIPGPDERMMSPQNIMYVWALRNLGWDVRGFIYDYARTKPPTEPRILKSGGVSQAARMDTDLLTYCMALKKAHGKQWKRFAKTVYRDKIEHLRARETLWFARERIPVEGPRVGNGFAEFIDGCKAIEQRESPVRTYLYNCRWNCDYHEPCVAQFQGLDIERLMRTQFVIQPERYTLEEIN